MGAEVASWCVLYHGSSALDKVIPGRNPRTALLIFIEHIGQRPYYFAAGMVHEQ